MIKGASDVAAAPVDGWYIERPELAEYLAHGYIINTHTTSVSPVPNGGSETLEYALDDFSIAQFAQQLGDGTEYRQFMKRSANWANLFDTSTGTIAPRDAEGALMHTPITSNGQSGFQEGNAAQYTWMVPQDLRDLIAGMGGNAVANASLDRFFTKLNAGQSEPNAWMGNEPTLGSPWVYLTSGEPWQTQQLVRQTIETLYNDTPQGLAGNDDLGTMSAWYVWAAIGLYPQNPAVRGLDIGSPLFTHVRIRSPHGVTLDIHAPQASAATPYVQRLSINGTATQQTWIALPLHGTTRLDFDLAASPNKRWGALAPDAPPSYSIGPVTFAPSTPARLNGSTALNAGVSPGASSRLAFDISNPQSTQSAAVSWRAQAPAGLSIEPASGVVEVAPGGSVRVAMELHVPSGTATGVYDVPISAKAGNGAVLEHLTAAIRVAYPGQALALGYVENRFDDTVTPFDPATGAIAPAIAVGTEPRDAAMSPDGKRLYVADRGAQSISVIDTVAQRTIATIRVGNSPNGIAITPDGKCLWVANYDDGTIQAIDTRTLAAATPVAIGPNPKAIAIAPGGAMLYVTDQAANTVVPFDLRTRTAGAPIAVGAQPAGIAITPDGKRAYVADFGSDDVTPIDLPARQALRAIPTGVSPVAVAIAPNGRVAYVSNYAASTITPIDIATDTAGEPIRVGGAPYGIAFTRDSKTAYVVLRRDNAFVPVDVSSGLAGAPIVLGTSPYTITLP